MRQSLVVFQPAPEERLGGQAPSPTPEASSVSQPQCTCAAQTDAERGLLRQAACVLPAHSLCKQFVCLPQPFAQDF